MEGRQPALDLLGPHPELTAVTAESSSSPRQLPAVRRPGPALVPALVLLLLLAGCTAPWRDVAAKTVAATPATSPAGSPSGSPTGSPGSPAAGTPSPSRSASAPAGPAVARPVPPEVGSCYRLRFRDVTRPTSDRRPVDCAKRHTAVTVFVGRLDTVLDGHALAVDSDLVTQRLTGACPRRLAYLGGGAGRRALSRFEAVWFRPTVPESDAGGIWYRCDLVALAAPEQLAPLPGPRRLRGILDRPGSLDEFGLCGTATPGARDFERVICSRPHSWQAVSTIPLPGGKDYPGTARVREAGDADCRDLVQRRAGSADEFRYGWEWPTRDQWQRGQRHGYCWAEDS